MVNTGLGLPTVIKQVVYTRLFLLGRVFKWFKPYFTKIQENRLTIINLKVKYIFLIQKGFYKYITWIFKSLNKELMAKNKLKIL